jgi:hypothetical protein
LRYYGRTLKFRRDAMKRIDLDNLEKQARTALGMSQSGEVSYVVGEVPTLIARMRLLERAAGAAAVLLKRYAETGGRATPEMTALHDALEKAGAIPPDWDDWFSRQGLL